MRLYRLSRLLEIIQPASIFLKTFMPYLVFSQGHRNRWQPDNQWMHSLVGLWLSPLVSHYLFFVGSLYSQNPKPGHCVEASRPDTKSSRPTPHQWGIWRMSSPPTNQPTGSHLNQLGEFQTKRFGWLSLLVDVVILNTHPLLVLYIPNQPNGSQYSVQPPVNDYHRAGSIFAFVR